MSNRIEEEKKKCDYGSNGNVEVDRLFEQGNYSSLAMMNERTNWKYYAALGLVGKKDEAIEGLVRFDTDEARFYEAVALWISEDDSSAIRLLENLPLKHAQNLLALIKKDRINVLSQFVWQKGHPNDFVAAVKSDSKFRVNNIGFDPRYLQNNAYSKVESFYDVTNPPDFYIVHMIEWHYLPIDLYNLPCPKFGHTADYDYCYQTIYPCLSHFNEIIVSCGEEWEDVRNIVGVPVSTFPKCVAITDELPDVKNDKRIYDVFFSGSTIEPVFMEKAKLILETLRLKGRNVKIIDGFLPYEDYFRMLNRSKISITYYRRPGGTVTRGLDALSMGCSVIAQKESVLRLYLGEQSGLSFYDYDSHTLSVCVENILNNWDYISPQAEEGAKIVRREFSKSKVVSQYLRYLTFLAARPSNNRPINSDKKIIQKRLVYKRALPCPVGVLNEVTNKTANTLQSDPESCESPQYYLNLNRDRIMAVADNIEQGCSVNAKNKDISGFISSYKEGINKFPDSIVLMCNYVRMALHFGSSSEVRCALETAKRSLDKNINDWTVDAEEDIFPWDFFRTLFDYKQYFDALFSLVKNKNKSKKNTLIRIALSAISFYVSFYSNSQKYVQKAIDYNCDFPFYKLRLAYILSQRENTKDVEYAQRILSDLLQNTFLFRDAFQLLKQIKYNKRIELYESSESLMNLLENNEDVSMNSYKFEAFNLIMNLEYVHENENLVKYF